MANTPDRIGQLLLLEAKCYNNLSAKELHKVDCVRIESCRDQFTMRTVHRCVLEVASDFFRKELAKLRRSREKSKGAARLILACGINKRSWSNTLRLDASPDVIDIILDHLYNVEEPIEITYDNVITSYAAARRFGLDKMAQKAKEFFRLNIGVCLIDPQFFERAFLYANDIESLVDIVDDVGLGNITYLRLMQGVAQWAAGEKDTEKKWTASKIYMSLLRSPKLSNAEQDLSVAVVGRKWDTFAPAAGKMVRDVDEYTIVSADTLAEIRTGTNDNSLLSKVVIYKDRLYEVESDTIHVRRLDSVSSPTDDIQAWSLTDEQLKPAIVDLNDDGIIRGVCVFSGEVFFYTDSAIYALDAQGVRCVRIARISGLPFANGTNAPAILNRNSMGLIIAAEIGSDADVWAFTFRTGSTIPTSSIQLQTRPSTANMSLIGVHEGLFYYLCEASGMCFHYTALRGETEVKRRPIVEGGAIQTCRIYGGLLCVVVEDKDNDYVCGFDLSSDTIVFRRTTAELGLVEPLAIIPVIATTLQTP